MKYIQIILLLMVLMSPLGATKYAGEIFSFSPGVVNQAMGNTGLTFAGSMAAGWWNPALLAERADTGVELMRSEHFEGLLSQNQISLRLGKDTSLIVNHLAIDKVKLTKLEHEDDPLSNDNRPYVWKTVTNQDLIIYGGFARALRENLYVGISPKLAYRDLAEHSGYGFGADISTYFDINDDLLIGLTLRDFFTTRIFWDNGTHEMVRPGLDAELNYDFTIPFANSRARVFAGTEIMAEGRKEAATHSVGSFSFDYHLGLEIPVPEYLSFYAGYDVDNLTTGLTVNIKQYQINYAFKYNTELDNSHRVSLGLKLY